MTTYENQLRRMTLHELRIECYEAILAMARAGRHADPRFAERAFLCAEESVCREMNVFNRAKMDAMDHVKMESKFDSDAAVVDGVVRWKSNGAVPPQEVLDVWLRFGKDFDHAKSSRVRIEEDRAFLAAYREARVNQPISHEERYEARAAFGPGVEVVNAITGQKFTT